MTNNQKWISVKERLPSEDEVVGYVFDGKDIRTDVFYPGYNNSWESCNSLDFYVDEKNITHWMPLPKKPNI